MDAPEPLLIKFAKTIYENPLILLLRGSAGVSAVMGNIDDAVSITVAVLIVLTGELLLSFMACFPGMVSRGLLLRTLRCPELWLWISMVLLPAH